jgi:hypothetical protein
VKSRGGFKSKYRAIVVRLMDADPAIGLEALRRAICEEMQLDHLPSRTQVFDLRREYLLNLRMRTPSADSEHLGGWPTDRLIDCLRRNHGRFTPSAYLIAELLVHAIEANASAEFDHLHAPEFAQLRDAAPQLQEGLDALRADAAAIPAPAGEPDTPESVALRGEVRRLARLTYVQPGAIGDWNDLRAIVETLGDLGAPDPEKRKRLLCRHLFRT